MINPSQSSPSRRLLRVLAVTIALPLISLVPAFLASSLLTHDVIDQFEPIEQAAAIDVADIDPEGTVMYTVSPPNGNGGDSDIEFFVPVDMLEVIQNGDLIKVTVIDQGTDYGFSSSVDSELEEEGCLVALSLSSDDRSNNRIGKYSGYIRIKDDDGFTATYAHDDLQDREDCGLYITYTD